MNPTLFKAGGALTDEHAAIYVERKADYDAIAHLRAMDYLLVVEPRQQGKTSLINHLMCHSTLGYVNFAYIDVTTPDHLTEATWYQTLCPRILRQLRDFITREQWPAIPQNSTGWRDFLCDITTLATDANRFVVIALDEIGAVTFPGATEFFSVLRDVYNSRQAETEFKQLTFLLVGAFHPRDLIKDDKISPFNIAQRVRLEDFSLPRVRELVRKGELSEEQINAVSERIHYWVDGQPYLTQLLCSYLGPNAVPTDVDAGIERLRREDENHLPPLLERLNSDEKLRKYVERIQAGARIKFNPGEDRRHKQLELLGIVKADIEGYCVVRNRIYEQALCPNDNLSLAKPVGQEQTERVMNIPIELLEPLHKRNVALFIGADLPLAVTGLPSRADLAHELARRKGLDESLSLAEATQRVSQAGNRWEFTDFIRNALDTNGKLLRPFHQWIVALVKEHQMETIITTAYDNLLELAFQQVGVGINRVVRGSDVSFIQPDRPTLIKLYGDAQQPDTLVVTDRDHSDLLRDRDKEPLVDEVRQAFRRNTVCFLGYNLTDPDFRFLFDQIAQNRFARTAYAVWPGLPEADVRMWQDRGMVILDVDPFGILGEVVTQPAPVSRPDATITPPVTSAKQVWDTAAIRQLVTEAFNDGELTTLCFDHFRPVYEAFSSGMSKTDKVQQLIEYCERRNQLDALLKQVEKLNPHKYQEFASRVRQVTVAIDQETSVAIPRRANMDFKRGFQFLRKCLAEADPKLRSELMTLEERFEENERAERLFGSSENTRNARSQIIYALNNLALGHCGVSFNDLCQGVEPASSPLRQDQPAQPSVVRREQAWVRFKLQIARLVNLEFEVRAFETPMGEPPATTGRLPYTLDELGAVLKALGMPEYDAGRFTPAQQDTLQRLDLVLTAHFVPDLHKRVGQALFDSLTVGDVSTAFQLALNRAREIGGTVALQLRFDEDTVQLAQYPWELLYYRRALLPSSAVELTRYISYPEAATALSVTPPLRLVYIQSRPTDLSTLATDEQAIVRGALAQLANEQLLRLDVLTKPTYESLLDYLETNIAHILHFDGHGTFARQCPACHAMNYPHQTQCQAKIDGDICGQDIASIGPQGYLAFENANGRVEWVSSEILGNLLYKRPLRLAVLSACRSGGVGGETLFGGVAPALIQAGVPAVVSTQLPISVDAATKFMQGFYRALARFESLPAAVNAGRIRVIQTNEWFIPTLYLRSKDDEGNLFSKTGG